MPGFKPSINMCSKNISSSITHISMYNYYGKWDDIESVNFAILSLMSIKINNFLLAHVKTFLTSTKKNYTHAEKVEQSEIK